MTNSTEVSTNNTLSSLTTDVNVGMDEVVSVFVSKYEDQLFAKKAELSSLIKQAKCDLDNLDKQLKGSIDTTKYIMKNEVLGIESNIHEFNVVWDSKNPEKSLIKVVVRVSDVSGNTQYHSTFNKSFTFDITTTDVSQHFSLTDEVTSLNNDLVEVMVLIKSVGRKERQIRGKISEMKLKDSGLSGLLDSGDMLALIKLD